jgi:signal recognition particle receptor subunit beta
MALFNYATKEITIKIVYYGPGLSGKTTNLQYLHSFFDPSKRGKLISLATEADRTLFFDFLPIELGKINDFSIRFQLYTVPGQVRYNATRKLVLKGADAIIFVADSQRDMREPNIESLRNMKENLISNNIEPDDIPIMYQYNKRDLRNILSVEELNSDLNPGMKYDYREGVAVKGTGVEETFRYVTRLVIKRISEKHGIREEKEVVRPEEMPSSIAVPFGPEGEMFPSVGAAAGSPDPETEPIYDFSPHDSVLYGEAEEVLPEADEIPAAPEPILEETAIREPFTEESLSLQNAFGEAAAAEPDRVEEKYLQPSPREAEPVIKEIREIREVPLFPAEKLEEFSSRLFTMSRSLEDMKSELAGIHGELRDLRKDQKEIIGLLRETVGMVSLAKSRKRWFNFS